jgi:hypothetical protein
MKKPRGVKASGLFLFLEVALAEILPPGDPPISPSLAILIFAFLRIGCQGASQTGAFLIGHFSLLLL